MNLLKTTPVTIVQCVALYSKVGKRAAHARLNQALVLTESSLEKHSE
jgi:hypothetical protein